MYQLGASTRVSSWTGILSKSWKIGEERSAFVEPTFFSQKIQIREVSLKNSGNYLLITLCAERNESGS